MAPNGSDAIQELEHSPGEQRGRIRVVRRERAVGEVVLVAGVQEELRVLDLLHDLAGGVDVALADEDRVVVHAVDLDRDAVRPGSEGPLAADREAGVEEQGSAGSGPCLCELLRRQHAEREPGVDELGRQFVGDADAALPHLVESDLTDVGETLVDALERASVEQVRRVHDVAGGPQVVGERAHAGGQPLCVVEQQDLGHTEPPGRMVGRTFDHSTAPSPSPGRVRHC